MGQVNHSITHYLENKDSKLSRIADTFTAYKLRVPYLWERFTGQNMNYYYAQYAPNNLLTTEMRQWVKNGDTNSIK
jgi:hypothetical protein